MAETKSIEVTPEMIEAGAEVIYEADWEFKANAEVVAKAVYCAMESARPLANRKHA